LPNIGFCRSPVSAAGDVKADASESSGLRSPSFRLVQHGRPIEPSRYRRDLAMHLGARAAVGPGEDVGESPQVVIESSGRPDCIRQAFDVVDNMGIVLQSGECHAEVAINPSETFIRREITYTGSWYYASEDYPDMRDLLERGLPLKRMCTHDVAAAFAQSSISDFLDGRTGKVVLRWT
jgi:L-iditol 2-dehydrogenase